MKIPSLPPGVTLTTLDNGLVIIVREDHSAPVVSAQAWCMAGSIHEGKWLGAGLSHVLEHMLFKGTTTRPGSRIDQEVQEAGGYMNAYTSFDRTVYHIDVPATGARTAIDVLCDIMQHATLPDDELARELDVIRREMDMGQDDPGRRASRRLFETAYTRSPYRFTVIGYPDIFDELKPDDIRGYYAEKYAPNNRVLRRRRRRQERRSRRANPHRLRKNQGPGAPIGPSDCPTSGGNPISGTYGINLQQGDGNTFTGGDVEGCSTALHLGANAQNNTIVGLRNENSTNQVVADAGSSYNNWMTGGTMFTGQLTDNGTRNSFLDTFHRSFNGLNGDWYGSQKDATVTNHYRLGIGRGKRARTAERDIRRITATAG